MEIERLNGKEITKGDLINLIKIVYPEFKAVGERWHRDSEYRATLYNFMEATGLNTNLGEEKAKDDLKKEKLENIKKILK